MVKKIIKKISPRVLISCYHFLWAFLSALFCGFPSHKIKVIGITGTNGKTTTANMASAILEEAGYKVAVASSIKFKIGQEEKENKLKMTMPGRGVLQKFLRQAVKAGCQYAIIEATSEGTLQHRHRFINFQVMVFTNLSAEHIERHNGFENYKKAKGQYFKVCKGTHIINADDDNAEYFWGFPAIKKIGYSLNLENVHITSPLHSDEVISQDVIKAEQVEEKDGQLLFVINSLLFVLPLIGRFNVSNALAAISCGLSQRVSLNICQKALAKVSGVPGRMEEVIREPFRVVVDYAFTPNALEQVYQTLSRQPHLATQSLNHLNTHLICVLGACGGGRDSWKRPVLGEIANRYCGQIIITNEDPYDENPINIINDVAKGAGQQALKILDRREAIRKAMELAKPNDTIVITGKGCEPWICIENGKKIPWDDRQVAREEFKKLA